jgi:hypothetical protein
MLIRQLLASRIGGIGQKQCPCLVCQSAECDDRLGGGRRDHGRDPFIAVSRNVRVPDVLITPALPIDAVQKRVEQDVAVGHAELCEKSLNAMTGSAYEDAADDRFMLGRILSDAKDARGAIETPAVKDRPPFGAEGAVGIDARVGRLVAQCLKRVADVTGIEIERHRVIPMAD